MLVEHPGVISNRGKASVRSSASTQGASSVERIKTRFRLRGANRSRTGLAMIATRLPAPSPPVSPPASPPVDSTLSAAASSAASFLERMAASCSASTTALLPSSPPASPPAAKRQPGPDEDTAAGTHVVDDDAFEGDAFEEWSVRAIALDAGNEADALSAPATRAAPSCSFASEQLLEKSVIGTTRASDAAASERAGAPAAPDCTNQIIAMLAPGRPSRKGPCQPADPTDRSRLRSGLARGSPLS